jgi:hypothetical protein
MSDSNASGKEAEAGNDVDDDHPVDDEEPVPDALMHYRLQ